VSGFKLEKLLTFEHQEVCVTFAFNRHNTEELFFFTAKEVFRFAYLKSSQGRATARPDDPKSSRTRVYEMKNTLDK